MLRSRIRSGFLLMMALVACAPQQPEPPAEEDEPMSEASASMPLVPTLQAEQFPDSIQLYLRVTNSSTEPVEITFPTGQSFDFVVMQEGEEAWRWSADKMFTQAFRTETLGAGETEVYRATWTPPPNAEGAFTVRGVLAARDHRVEQVMEIMLP